MIEDFCNKLKQNPAAYKDKLCVTEIRCGGSCCPPHIISYLLREWDIELSHGWGMTECMPGCHSKHIQRRRDLYMDTNEILMRNQLKQGTFNCSMEAMLVSADNKENELEKDGQNVGELLIRGPCITRRYYKV